MKSISINESQIQSSSGGHLLYVKNWVRGLPKIHVFVVHGALEHSGRHNELVEYFLALYQDISITAFDLLGHGKSGGSRAYINSFDLYVKDFEKVILHSLEKINRPTKNFIFAHSLGGLITLDLILTPKNQLNFPINGVILSSPCIKPRVYFEGISQKFLTKLDKVSPKLHLPLIYKGAELTRDSHRANDFNTDSLIPKFITTSMANQIIKASEKLRGFSYYLNVPTLFLISGTDYIVDAESTRLFALGADKNIVKVIDYPEHYHELWNETNRIEIFKTMNKWLINYLKE